MNSRASRLRRAEAVGGYSATTISSGSVEGPNDDMSKARLSQNFALRSQSRPSRAR